jgi:hypothetical protein
MSSHKYRLQVRKVPSTSSEPTVSHPSFPPYDELHLELLENKNKVKRNAPKPVFVRNPNADYGNSETAATSRNEDFDIDDFTLEKLEKAYDEERSERGGGGHEDSHDTFRNEPTSHNDREDTHQYSHRESQNRVPEPSRVQPESYQKTTFAQPANDAEPEEDPEDVEMRLKQDYLMKFIAIKKSYPSYDIPEFTMHSDVKTMKYEYEFLRRRLDLDVSVDSYRDYLVKGSYALEFVSSNWIGVDMVGFAKQQERSASKYDRLLIELGEKNYSPEPSRFPVEVRLLFMVLIQAVTFAAMKNMFKGGDSGNKSGPTATTKKPAQSFTSAPDMKSGKPRMRGPTITPKEVQTYSEDHYDSDELKEKDD